MEDLETTIRSGFFSVNHGKEFLANISAISKTLECEECSRTMQLQIYRAIGKETIIYRCPVCRNVYQLFQDVFKENHI